MKKILFLEDDSLLGETLCEDLQELGYSVDWVKDAAVAAECAYDSSYDLYLFDVNVPTMSGFELLSLLRDSADDTPTLFLTARSNIKDLKRGFDSGADDYVTKPFEMEALLVRMEAKMRNSRVAITNSFFIDRDRYTLFADTKPITLPKKEFEILDYFITYKNRVVSKDEILSKLYEDEYISDTTFRVYIKNLNSYLNPHAKLVNIRGVGYRFETV